MNKGQISLDLMLSVLALMVFATLFVVMSGQFSESQQVISIQSQQKAIGENLAKIVTTSAALKPAVSGSGTIQYTVPKIFSNDGTEILCTIAVTNTKITLSSTFESKNVSTEIDYQKVGNPGIPANISCGGNVTITAG